MERFTYDIDGEKRTIYTKEELVDVVFEQIKIDIAGGDFSRLKDFLMESDNLSMICYLPEFKYAFNHTLTDEDGIIEIQKDIFK